MPKQLKSFTDLSSVDFSLNTFIDDIIMKCLIEEILEINKRDINNKKNLKIMNPREKKFTIKTNLNEEDNKNNKLITALDACQNKLDNESRPVYLLTNNKHSEVNNLLRLINKDYETNKLSNPFFLGNDYVGGNKKVICDKKADFSSVIIKEKINIKASIESIEDLLTLIDKYPIMSNVEYNINIQAIHDIKEPLENLNCMIGMHQLKTNIMDQILYFIQNLHISKSKTGKDTGDFLHTVIYGPPGTGKTEVARIMGEIFCKLGILKKNKFKKATRSDLIAGYLGQTALKTRDLIKECLDGVLFIDEAYALGNTEKRDSFAKECIDTLCEALSDNKERLMVIIAGYEKELDECFFNYNQGLESRFTWRFKTDDYNSKELMQIFSKKVNDAGWSIENDKALKEFWFEEKMNYFKYYGRDMETLFAKTKIAHSRRVFCEPEEVKTKLTVEDLDKGFNMFTQNEEVKSRNEDTNVNNSMYM